MATVKRTFTLPDDISEQLDKTVPNKERSKFIAVSLREALKERNKEKLLEMLEKGPRWKNSTGRNSEGVLREIREKRTQTLISNVQS